MCCIRWPIRGFGSEGQETAVTAGSGGRRGGLHIVAPVPETFRNLPWLRRLRGVYGRFPCGRSKIGQLRFATGGNESRRALWVDTDWRAGRSKGVRELRSAASRQGSLSATRALEGNRKNAGFVDLGDRSCVDPGLGEKQIEAAAPLKPPPAASFDSVMLRFGPSRPRPPQWRYPLHRSFAPKRAQDDNAWKVR